MINFPKVELHVHLEGTIPSYLLCNLAQKNDMLDMLPSLHWIDKAQWSSPDEWIKIMHACSNSCIRTEHDYYFLTHHYLHELIKQNTIYCELSVSVNRSQKLNLDFRKIINSVSRAIQEVNLKNDIKVGIIAALTYGTSQTDLEMQIEQIISLKSSGIVGIDLHGLATHPMVDFSHFFKIASKNGLGLRVHAGEFQGAESVIEAIEDLDINRVAHGIRSIEDSKAIALLLERNIALDICYSSNRSFGILGEKYDDSLRELFYKGIALNISSDDPLYFNTTLSNEYNIFKNFLGFSKEELIEINKKAIQHSFASHEDKKILLDILLSNTMVPGL